MHVFALFMLHSSECGNASEIRRTSLDIGTTVEEVHTCCVQLTMAHSMQLYTPVNVEQYVLRKAVTLMCAAPSLVLKPASSV